MLHPFLERELEFDSSLFHVNDSTNCSKKRTSQNNWTRGFTLNVHNSEINGNIIVIDNDKNIIDLPQRFLYRRINKTNTKRTRIKRFQIKHIIHSFGHNRSTCSNITKSKTREVIQFNFYHRIVGVRGRKHKFFITYETHTQDLCYSDVSNRHK